MKELWKITLGRNEVSCEEHGDIQNFIFTAPGNFALVFTREHMDTLTGLVNLTKNPKRRKDNLIG